MSMKYHRRRIYVVAALAATVVAPLLIASKTSRDLQNIIEPQDGSPQRQKLYVYDFLQSLSARKQNIPTERSRDNCQFVFVIGVERAIYHGFAPILTKMAQLQTDPVTGPYEIPGIHSRPRKALRRAIYNADGKPDPEEVAETMSRVCPNDGRKRVYIDDKSWPHGLRNRDEAWQSMTPLEISMTETAMNEPTNLYHLMEAYGPYADIKFIVLHRPYLELIASKKKWDGGPIGHSNVLRGHMLLLREFLDNNIYDETTGSRTWTVLCTEQVMSRNYENEEQVMAARRNVVRHLADFLGWSKRDCPDCFDHWQESSKDPVDVLGKKNLEVLADHMKSLVGVWPPRDETMYVRTDSDLCRL